MILAEARDYMFITLGLAIYTVAFTVFLMPYQIVAGGVTDHQRHPAGGSLEDFGCEIPDEDDICHLHPLLYAAVCPGSSA